MILRELNILNYKNIADARLSFSNKLNCFVGLNGQGKTNVLDAIYLLSFTKSAFSVIDSQNITHEADMAMVQGVYDTGETISCGIKRGQRKQFRNGSKDYVRLVEHIGHIPLVLISPEDAELIVEGSDERRRFMDVVIAQKDKLYLEALTSYNAVLKQRNALLKQYAEAQEVPSDLFDVLEEQMVPYAEYIYDRRSAFIQSFVPVFQNMYDEISGGGETVGLEYVSQLQDRDIREALQRTRKRDLILGWTSQGVHKDELQMMLGDYPLKRVGSQGQQKSYLLAMKFAQAVYLASLSNDGENKTLPILLLDDIFDKLDSERVERIIRLVRGEAFGQIFITDTDRQHLTELLSNQDAKIFVVSSGQIVEHE